MQDRAKALAAVAALSSELRAAREALERVVTTLSSVSSNSMRSSFSDLSAERRIFELTMEVISDLETEARAAGRQRVEVRGDGNGSH